MKFFKIKDHYSVKKRSIMQLTVGGKRVIKSKFFLYVSENELKDVLQ